MNFKELLDEIMCKFDDGLGLFLMGYDGIAVEKSIKDSATNLEILAAEYTNLLRISQNSLKDIQGGNLDEIINITDELVILLKIIATDYFLFMVLKSGANFGRARFELKKAKYILEKELI